MSWPTIRNDIKTVIEEVGEVAVVSSLPTFDFAQFPAVSITLEDVDSEVENIFENLQVFIFKLRVLYNASTEGVGTAISKVEEAVDAVINRIDQEEQFGVERVIGASLGAGYQILDIVPVMGPWFMNEDTKLVGAEVRLRVRASFDINA